jgi:hypothetical protein
MRLKSIIATSGAAEPGRVRQRLSQSSCRCASPLGATPVPMLRIEVGDNPRGPRNFTPLQERRIRWRAVRVQRMRSGDSRARGMPVAEVPLASREQAGDGGVMIQLTSTMERKPSTDCRAARSRVRNEFVEMPGLVVTDTQAMRLFGLDLESCREVLAELVTAGFLATDGRRYFRAN